MKNTDNVKFTDVKGLWYLSYRSIAGGKNAITCSSLYCYSMCEIILTEKTNDVEYYIRILSGTP